MSTINGINLDRTLDGYRFTAIQMGDTMQWLAQRELGDAALWVDLVNINGLQPPYITADPTQASVSVKTYGDLILVPSPQQVVQSEAGAEDVYFTDIALQGGRLVASAAGNVALVSGLSNLEQGLVNALATDKRELLFHPEYGTWLRRVIGSKNNRAAEHLAAGYVKATLVADVRVQRVISVSVQLSLDVINIHAVIQPVAGQPLSLGIRY